MLASGPHGPDRETIRGTALRTLFKWYIDAHGRDELNRRLSAMDPSGAQLKHVGLHRDKELFGVLATRWYDERFVHALFDALTHDLDEAARDEMAAQATSHIMRTTLTGVYKVLFEWMANPARYAKHASRLWSAFFRSGQFVVVAHEDECFAECTISKWSAHHPFMCSLNFYAATEIYSAMGLSSVATSRTHCVDDGAPHCCYRTRWT